MLWTVVLEKTLESPLDSNEIQPVHHKGNQSWIFIGRSDAKAETPILWPPDVKNWLIWKDSDAGKDWRREEEMTENEKVGWHHQLDGHEFEQVLGDGDGQGSLACCSPWGCRVGHNWVTELNWFSSKSISLQLLYISRIWKYLYRYHNCIYVLIDRIITYTTFDDYLLIVSLFTKPSMLISDSWGLASTWHIVCIY